MMSEGCWQPPEAGREVGQILPLNLWKEPTLPTPSSQTSGLQDCETTNVSALHYPVCNHLLKQPQEGGDRRGGQGSLHIEPGLIVTDIAR